MIRRATAVLGLLLAIEAGCTVVPTDNPKPKSSPGEAHAQRGEAA